MGSRICSSISALANPAARAHLMFGAVALAAAGPSFAQDDIAALKEQLRMMQERLEKLEKDKATTATAPAHAAPANVVTTGDTPGSFKLPGTNTSVTIGGFVKGVGILSSRSAGPANPGDEAFLPSTIPLASAPTPPVEKDKVKFNAKESRLAVRTSTPTSLGLVTTLVEGDFGAATGSETSTNGYGFRLRHAWATLGGLGVGQTWSNALNLSAIPETIDFGAIIGMLGAPRQAGVRWTSEFSNGFWSAALENPETTIAGAATQPDNDRLPDVNAKINYRAGFGTFELAGVWRRLASNTAGVNSANGYGVAVSGAIPTIGKDRFIFQVGTGRGLGRYFGTGVAFDANVVGTTLTPIKNNGGYVGYRHYWTDTLRSSIDFEWLNLGYGRGTPSTLDNRYWSTHVNLFWNATPNALLGIEAMRGSRRIQTGQSGYLNRLLVTGIYTF